MIRLRLGKFCPSGLAPRGVFRQHRAVPDDLFRQARVLAGIDDVDAAAQNGDRPLSRLQRGAVGDGIDAACQSADDGDARSRHVVREGAGRLTSVGRRLPGADDGHGALVLRRQLPTDVEHRRQVVDLL